MATLLYNKDKLDSSEFQFSKYREDAARPEDFLGLDQDLATFFTHTKNWKLKWNTLSTLDFSLEGSINILPFEDILHFDEKTFFATENPVMKGFRLLDYFYNEGAVGLCINDPERGLYYFEFDGETEALHLDLKGCLDLVLYTRGVGYWQLMILTHLYGKLRSGVADIREHMPELFLDFSYEGFIERYEAVRMH